MYRENAARQENEESATDIAEFIASLGVVTDIDTPQEGDWPRLSQLTQRTNQFNFTTVRRTEGEIRAVAAAGTTVLRLRVRDRFGDYGLVGLVIAANAGDTLLVDTFLLSCRVLGRGVEHAILRKLGQIAQERGLARVDLPYIKSSKNEPAFAFIESVAASFRVEQTTQIVYSIPADQATTIAHRPGHDPAEVVEARKSEERKSVVSSTANDGIACSERYSALAHMLASSSRLTEATNAADAKSRSQPWRPEPPQTKLEHELVAIWERLLGVRGLGVEDDYAAVGGTSLIAARLFAEIYRRFGTRLPLTTILEAPTVRALARRLQNEQSSASGALIELKRGVSRNLFLIHDGDGETLLYANFARRMPADLAVFGVEPLRTEGVPLAHATIEAIAAFYLKKVRSKQPYGPYLLGGMCAGGVIAFEMASQLLQSGQEVALVAVLDAAAPGAARIPRRISKQRIGRLQAALDQVRKADSKLPDRTYVLLQVARKLANALSWEITDRSRHLWVKIRFKLLQNVLAQGRGWPKFLQEMTVRQIYDSAEAHYRPGSLSLRSMLLVRAKVGEGDDTPYREIYSDETLGWGRLVPNLTVLDVNGGHASMLQEPYVDSMVEALKPYIGHRASSSTTASTIEAALP
jgi:thioesterase domain-containing protein